MRQRGGLVSGWLWVVGIIIIAVSTFPRKTMAETLELQGAEQAYRRGDFAAAAEAYSSIIRSGWNNGEIYYNLGNCYYKMGHYGLAILNYERAQRLLGNDPDLEINLKLANLMIPDRLQPLPRLFLIRAIQSLAQLLSVKGWALIMLISEWILLLVVITLRRLNHYTWRRWLSGTFIISAALFLVSSAFYTGLSLHQASTVEGILLESKAEIRSAPENGATELFVLHEGCKFKVKRQVSGWAEIILPDGKQGWIAETAFETI